MNKVYTAIKDKIAEIEGEIRALELVVDGIGGKNRDKDLKEAKKKRQLLKDVLNILKGTHIYI